MLNRVFLQKTEDLAADVHSRLAGAINSAEPQTHAEREAAFALLDTAFDAIDELVARLEELAVGDSS